MVVPFPASLLFFLERMSVLAIRGTRVSTCSAWRRGHSARRPRLCPSRCLAASHYLPTERGGMWGRACLPFSCQQRAAGVIRPGPDDPGPRARTPPASCQRTTAGEAARLRRGDKAWGRKREAETASSRSCGLAAATQASASGAGLRGHRLPSLRLR